jgi:hypothetical protein
MAINRDFLVPIESGYRASPHPWILAFARMIIEVLE